MNKKKGRYTKKRLERDRELRRRKEEEREWLQNNPHINILNYPYYKLKFELVNLFRLKKKRFK